MRFHDAHAHAVEFQAGGLLIALEGDPVIPGTLDNAGVLRAQDPSRSLIGVPYARHVSGLGDVPGPIVKYHPRREKFGPGWVANDIRRFGRRLILIDTLNAMYWQPGAYRDLALEFPKSQFVMCHAGGYDIIEFVKMCRFLPNVWIDFSATQHTFGWVDSTLSPPMVGGLIDHALREPRIFKRVMYGSDNPEFDQRSAIPRVFEVARDPEAILTGNFERLLCMLG